MKILRTIAIASAWLILESTPVIAQQFNVTTQSFDLESIDRHKGWAMFSGFMKSDGNYVLKIGSPWCNSNTSGSTTTYNGVGYKFEELEFDKSLSYKGKTEKSFETTLQTLAYEPLYGDKFYPQLGTTWMKRYITNEFVGQKTVMPIIEVSGYKIASYLVGGQATANHPKFGASSCGELIEMRKLQEIKMKENKGERWMAVDFAAIPGGGVIVFATDGVIKDQPDKGHYMVKLFDGDLNEIAQVHIALEYKAILSILPVDKPNGKRDFIVIAQATDFKYSAGKEVKSPTYAELIYLDGTNLAIKNKQPITLSYTNWYAESTEVDAKGNIYIYGTAKGDAKSYVIGRGALPINQPMPNPNTTNSAKDQPNFQLLCLDAAGNVKYFTAVDAKNDVANALVISGTAKKAKPEIIFNTFDFKKDVYFTDRYLILAGQQYVGANGAAVDKGSLFIACFDLASGKLLKYYIKPETTYAGYHVIFNKDRNTIYWATYDLEEHNKLDGEQGAMSFSSFKNMAGADLYLCKIDLNAATATNFEQLGKEQWALNFFSPIVVTEDGSDAIIFQGRSLAKKAKDSELILIEVKK